MSSQAVRRLRGALAWLLAAHPLMQTASAGPHVPTTRKPKLGVLPGVLPGVLTTAEMLAWREAQPVLPERPRFASMCIVNEMITDSAERERVVSMCCRMLCSLHMTSRPVDLPLVLVNEAVTAAQRARLQRVGAELIVLPTLGFNSSNTAWMEWGRRKRKRRPPRFETYYKLFAWGLKGPRILGWVDADTMPVRNASDLLYAYPSTSALSLGVTCHAWNAYTSRSRHELYFNSGVMAFRPDSRAFVELMETLRLGNYTFQDGVTITEQDILQSWCAPIKSGAHAVCRVSPTPCARGRYWQDLGGRLPHPLPDGFNWRGYPCQRTATSSSTVAIIHKHSALLNLTRHLCGRGLWRAVRHAELQGKCRVEPAPCPDAAAERRFVPGSEHRVPRRQSMPTLDSDAWYGWVEGMQESALQFAKWRAAAVDPHAHEKLENARAGYNENAKRLRELEAEHAALQLKYDKLVGVGRGSS
jgi:hypothetical protein